MSVLPSQVHDTLRKHLLADGFDLVCDLEKSHGSWLYDAKRNKIRSNWQRIIKQFESFAEKNPKHVRAPDAHFMAAELSIDLSQRSMRTEDFGVAKQNYQKVISTWPKNRLADDSAFALANILVRRDKQPAAARRTIELALPYANDRRK